MQRRQQQLAGGTARSALQTAAAGSSMGSAMLLLLAAAMCLLSVSAQAEGAAVAGAINAAQQPPPNFLLILMDDLDTMMSSSDRAYLPRTWRDVADQGTWFRNMAVSMAWCCPSRVSLFTGKLVHNSNITSSAKPTGGAWKFMTQGMDSEYLPVWLQRLGYSTYFTGKFLNQFNIKLGCPRGWTNFEGMYDDGSYDEWYYKPVFSTNCTGMWKPNGTYHQSDIIRDKGLGYIDDAVARGKPFFIELAPTGPHDQGLGKVAVPCKRHEGLYPGVSMPHFPNWGVPLPAVMGLSSAVSMAYSNSKYVPRLRTLAGVDEMIESVIARLDQHGVLNNTYIIVTSDNGFHLGEHGMSYEKFTMYEEDVRVPFFIRGPSVPRGVVTDYQMTMVDVPATILSLAGGAVTEDLDGVVLPLAALGSGIPITATKPPKPTASPPPQVGTQQPTPMPSQVWSSVASPAVRMSPKPSPGPPLPTLPPPPPSPTPPNSPPPSPITPPPPPPPPPPPYPFYPNAPPSSLPPSPTQPPKVNWTTVRPTERSLLETLEAQQLDQLQNPRSQDYRLNVAPGSAFSRTDHAAARRLFDNYTEVLIAQAAAAAASNSGLIVRDTIIIEGWLDINWSIFWRKNFRAVRVCSPVYVFGYSSTYQSMTCYKYTVWCIPANQVNKKEGLNLHELYDLGLDPYETTNRYSSQTTLAQRLINRLDAVLSAMAYCKGSECRNPWRQLHPDGSVNSLLEAMSPVFDALYGQLQKFAFRSCNLFYDPKNEITDPVFIA